jgi:hypothetical protein
MKRGTLAILIGGLILGVGAYFLFIRKPGNFKRSLYVSQFLSNPAGHLDWMIKTGARCGDAPFLFPTDGIVGYLWNDSFRLGHHHQGIDVFGGKEAGITPVYSTYPGYLTRLMDWKSSIIVRVPDDPLHPGRQIWLYYTHMADSEGNSYISTQFPAGTSEVFIPAGTLLGYQGNFSGTPDNPVGVHLHFSIVQDDGEGRFKKELLIENTLDPSPYFHLPLNAATNADIIPLCGEYTNTLNP